MTSTQKQYYQKMLGKDRLMPIIFNNHLLGFITFYIGNINDENKFVRYNMWDVLDDNEDGNICFIDQAWGDKSYRNHRLQFRVWKNFKYYLKNNFINVSIIKWNRWKNYKIYTFIKKI